MLKLLLTSFVALGLMAFGPDSRTENPHSLSVIACRAEPRTDWKEYERPIPGVIYWEPKPNRDGEYECQRDIIDLVPRHPMQNPDDLSQDTACANAALSQTPVWQDQHPGWAVVAVGCPKPVYDSQGNILRYEMPHCPREMVCLFDENAI